MNILKSKWKYEIGVHITLWLSYVVLLLLLSPESQNFRSEIKIGSTIIFFQLILFYTNYLFLVPQFWHKERRVIYLLSALALFLFTVFLTNSLIEQKAIKAPNIDWNQPADFQKEKRNSFITPPIQDSKIKQPSLKWIFRFRFMALSLITFLISWLLIISKRNRIRDMIQTELRNKKMEAEIKFLKAQMNPHFLFNALNNIYSLSINNSPRTSKMLIKLSELLRYNTYESSKNEVSLIDEIKYIESFIELYQLKTRNPKNIVFNYLNVDRSAKIKPLILLPFIENSFKHSGIDKDPSAWIKITLEVDENNIIMKIQNNIKQSHTVNDQEGIGLENIKQRLELEYPNSHSLQISNSTKTFLVSLILKR